MDRKSRREDPQWNARRLARLCARWSGKTDQPIDRTRRRELEADLAALLAQYRDRWGLSIVGLRLDPAGVVLRRTPGE